MKKIGIKTVLAAAVTLAAIESRADMVYTANGYDNDGAISAEAIFSFSSGAVTITLENLINGTHLSAGQAVSGVKFNISGISSSSVITDTSSGKVANIPGGIPVQESLHDWLLAPGQNSVELATTGVIGSGGKPMEMIIPSGTTYNHGIGAHNPYVLDSATFTLSNSDFTANSVVSGVTILFGTGPDAQLAAAQPLVVKPVPEASTIIAGASLLLAFGAGAIRGMRTTPKA